MSLFVTYVTPSLAHGVYAISTPPPATITAVGTGNTIHVGQLPWGPSESLQYPGGITQFWQMFAPAGVTRTGSAHIGTIRKGWPRIGGVRVIGSAPATASVTILSGASATLFA